TPGRRLSWPGCASSSVATTRTSCSATTSPSTQTPTSTQTLPRPGHQGVRPMTDYGHDLLFGLFVTPSVAGARHALNLAGTADRAGLDLVTFQDHPYQPALLDTWTLLSYAAARTERVRLSGNVLNLPLRPPAVLARA